MNKADGLAEVNDMEGWQKIDHNAEIAAHNAAAQDDERFMHSISSTANDTEWQQKRELSGKALGIMEEQGTTSNAMIFDNNWEALQTAGELLLSNIEQFYDQEKELRISGDQQQQEFITINQRKPDGSIDNSITAGKSDFTIGRQSYRETLRKAMLEQLLQVMQTITRTGGQKGAEIAIALLDIAVDLMDDLPGKDEALQRIRKINGQFAPEDEMTPEEKKKAAEAKEEREQIQHMMQQLQIAMAQAKVAVENSKQTKNMTDASMKKLDGFIKAMEAAGLLSVSPHLAQAADQLIIESQLIGNNGATSNNQDNKGGM
jgi:hypothetical protein